MVPAASAKDTGSSSNNVVVKEEEEDHRQVEDTGSSSNVVVKEEEEEKKDRQVEDTGSSSNNVVVKQEDAPEIAALVEALKAAADMPESGCAALLRIMHGHLGRVDAIVEAMKANRSNAQVQQLGCTALLELVDHDEDNLCSVWKDGRGVWFVVQAMKAHPGDAGVQRSACEALDSLVRNFDHRRRAENKGAVGAVAKALKVHVNDAQVMKSGCSALLNLLAGRLENIDQDVGLAEGVVETVVEKMKSYTSDAEVQLAGCKNLLELALDKTYLGPRVLEEGGVGAIVGSMRAHTSNADVQIAGCGTLDNFLKMALDKTYLGPHFVQEGGVGAIVGAMRAHTSNADVQIAGCEPLEKTLRGNLLVDRKELANEVTAAVCEAMEYHDRFKQGVISPVISAGLRVLSRFEDEEAGISAVLGAMEAHRSNCDLQKQALKILCDEYMPELGDRKEVTNKVTAAVYEAMKHHGCEILISLAEGNNENRIRVVEAGGLEAVIKALGTYDWRVDWQDLAVLLNPDDDTQSRAGEAGAVEAVVKMIQEACKGAPRPIGKRFARHSMPAHSISMQPYQYKYRRSHNRSCKERAVRALMKLVPGHEGNRRRFVEAGGFEALKEQYRSSSHEFYGMLREHTREALIALDPSWKPDDKL